MGPTKSSTAAYRFICCQVEGDRVGVLTRRGNDCAVVCHGSWKRWLRSGLSR